MSDDKIRTFLPKTKVIHLAVSIAWEGDEEPSPEDIALMVRDGNEEEGGVRIQWIASNPN